MYTWGQNVYGTLGIGNKTNTHIPTQITNVSGIVDISGGKYHSVLQDKVGNIYTCGTNTYGNLGNGTTNESLTFAQIPDFGSVMEISAGNGYTVISKEDGTVWGFGDYNRGDENFESQTNSLVPVQIGAENFKIEPKKKTMYVNDKEDLLSALEIKEFNLFYTRIKTAADYTWESSNIDAVEVQNGNLTAKAAGNSIITATDNVTGTTKQVERIVLNHEKDRIEKISINTKDAEILEECKYKIIIEESDKNGELKIETKDKTDKISLDGTNWFDNGILTDILNLTNKQTEMPFYIQTQNGTIIEYMLTIYIQSHDTSLEYIKVNGINVSKLTDGTYYIHIDALGEEVEINARALDKNAMIRIESEGYEIQETTKNRIIDAKETIISIYVKAEDGTVQKYTLLVSGLPEDSTLKQVIVNGEEAKYIEGKNTYQIRLSEEVYEVQAIATDNLAKVSINGEVDEISSQIVQVVKTGSKTIVKIKVTAQNRVDTGEYTLEITEKSNDNTLSYITVNGKNAKQTPDGSYIAEVKESVENAEIKIGATDEFAVVYLEEETENKNNITVTKEVTERETIYKIKVTSENGEEAEYSLTIKKLSSNTNIEKITVKITKEIQNEETGETIKEDTIEEVQKKEDGSYYLKINREDKAEIKVVLEDENASVKIKDSKLEKGENTQEIETITEITEITIKVQAEDGSVKEYTLKLEKKSNDTALKEITSNDIQKQETDTIYVDEALEEIDITFTTNSDFASIKMEGEENYEPNTITRKIKLNTTLEENQERTITVLVQAEDGTEEEHIIKIIKTAVIGIESVKVNAEEIIPKDDVYGARVESKDTAELEIVATKETTKIEIIERTQQEEETIENVISTAVGTLNTQIQLNTNPQNYIIRITSEAGSVVQDYDLILEKKSQNVSLSYVKVDGLEAIKSEDGNYTQTVSYKELHQIIIKTVDEKAKVKISYKDTGVDFTKSKLIADFPLEKTEKLEILITIQSENGEEAQYTLTVIDDTEERTTIKGKIITDNVNGEHISDITVYKIVEEDGITRREIYKQTRTQADGTFNICMYDTTDLEEILQAKYELVITKTGYLSYTIENIVLEADKEYDIGEYTSIAGDVIENGEINIGDLVSLNDNFGKSIVSENGEKAETAKYDLNEDGNLDLLDRDILKKNYGKRTEVVAWDSVLEN